MKLLTAQGAVAGVLVRALGLRPQGSSLFAAALLAFLILIVGAPVAMVILMSFRTGFPGEDVPFTMENYLDSIRRESPCPTTRNPAVRLS